MSIAETPRCPATISAPGWGTARCALPRDHAPTLHDGVRWYEILTMSVGWVVHEEPPAACSRYPTCEGYVGDPDHPYPGDCTWPFCAEEWKELNE